MFRLGRLFWIMALVSVPACRHEGGLKRVEVLGTVVYRGVPVERGLITFRPASGSRGPAAGSGIVDGKFLIPVEKGPIPGLLDVEVKIVNVASDSVTSGESALLKRGPGQLKSFSLPIKLTSGVNELNLSFPFRRSSPSKRERP